MGESAGACASSLLGGEAVSMTKERKPMGRPPIAGEPLKQHNVRLDPETVEKAKRLGGGELSAGIRLAVKRAREPRATKPTR